jgi:hypothetical protein
MFYYSKLVKKTKLLNFLTFYGIKVKSIFLHNYKFILCFYKNKIFFEYNNSISVIKNIFPIINSIAHTQTNILFVGTKTFSAQFFFLKKSKIISKLEEVKVSSFTNFVIEGFKFFNKKFKKNSSIIIFLNVPINDFLILESKKKKYLALVYLM